MTAFVHFGIPYCSAPPPRCVLSMMLPPDVTTVPPSMTACLQKGLKFIDLRSASLVQVLQGSSYCRCGESDSDDFPSTRTLHSSTSAPCNPLRVGLGANSSRPSACSILSCRVLEFVKKLAEVDPPLRNSSLA